MGKKNSPIILAPIVLSYTPDYFRRAQYSGRREVGAADNCIMPIRICIPNTFREFGAPAQIAKDRKPLRWDAAAEPAGYQISLTVLG